MCGWLRLCAAMKEGWSNDRFIASSSFPFTTQLPSHWILEFQGSDSFCVVWALPTTCCAMGGGVSHFSLQTSLFLSPKWRDPKIEGWLATWAWFWVWQQAIFYSWRKIIYPPKCRTEWCPCFPPEKVDSRDKITYLRWECSLLYPRKPNPAAITEMYVNERRKQEK